jgi:hypothetical protein
MKANTDYTSLQKTGRATGVLYLVIIAAAGFAQGAVRGDILAAGEPEAIAAAVAAGETLFRIGLAADLLAFLADAAVAVLLYVLLKRVNKTVALLAAAFRLVAHPAIAGLNLLNHFGAVLFAGGIGSAAAFEPAQAQALAAVALEAHRYGYLIAGAFFGVHCGLLGYLLYASGYIPKVLGILMAVAAAGYLVETFGAFLLPAYAGVYGWIVGVTAAVGEVSLAMWLVVKGVSTRQAPTAQVAVAS